MYFGRYNTVLGFDRNLATCMIRLMLVHYNFDISLKKVYGIV
jgi:hypothetical protein